MGQGKFQGSRQVVIHWRSQPRTIEEVGAAAIRELAAWLSAGRP